MFYVIIQILSPKGPHDLEDLALRGEPRVSTGQVSIQTGLEVVLHLVACPCRDRATPGVIAHCFQFVVPVPVQSLVAKGLAIATSITDSQAAIAPQFSHCAKAMRRHDEGTEHMRADRADPGDLLESLDLPVGLPQFDDPFQCLVPLLDDYVEQLVMRGDHVAFRPVGHLVEVAFSTGSIGPAAIELLHAKATVFALQAILAPGDFVPQLKVMLHRSFEDNPVILFGMIDFLEFAQTEQSAKLMHIEFIALLGTSGDQGVFLGKMGSGCKT